MLNLNVSLNSIRVKLNSLSRNDKWKLNPMKFDLYQKKEENLHLFLFSLFFFFSSWSKVGEAPFIYLFIYMCKAEELTHIIKKKLKLLSTLLWKFTVKCLAVLSFFSFFLCFYFFPFFLSSSFSFFCFFLIFFPFFSVFIFYFFLFFLFSIAFMVFFFAFLFLYFSFNEFFLFNLVC
jgi:hypothetical protein